ncbi:hypothetical protein EDB83DRAFT_2520448 [Lactarius deliciosus]|nr:hypothetical protein EDB83DRAFT_2520448 [Lactarius deliciosus]
MSPLLPVYNNIRDGLLAHCATLDDLPADHDTMQSWVHMFSAMLTTLETIGESLNRNILDDTEIQAFLIELRGRLGTSATVGWAEHSPRLVAWMENARLQKDLHAIAIPTSGRQVIIPTKTATDDFNIPSSVTSPGLVASSDACLLDMSTTTQLEMRAPVNRAGSLDEKSMNVKRGGRCDTCIMSHRKCVLMPRTNPSDPITCFLCRTRNVKCRRTATVPMKLRPPTVVEASSSSQVASSSVPSLTEVEDRLLPRNLNRPCDKDEDNILAAFWGAVCAGAKVQIQAAEARRDYAQREYIRALERLIPYRTSAETVSHSNNTRGKEKGKSREGLEGDSVDVEMTDEKDALPVNFRLE